MNKLYLEIPQRYPKTLIIEIIKIHIDDQYHQRILDTNGV